jgi:hypothetical protein
MFPNATFSLARAELEYWTGPYSDRPAISWASAADEVRAVADLQREGRIVLASDAAHYCDEMELDRPFSLYSELEGMFRTYAHLRNLAARPRTTVIAGHDPAVSSMFETVAPNCLDLTRRREG